MRSLYSLVVLFCVFSSNTAIAQTGSCWAFSLDGIDPQWPGYYNQQISGAARLADGFVICGTKYNHVFSSRDGNKVGRTNFGGAYIAKYDFSGNLKWLNYTIDSTYLVSSNWPTITKVAVDANDNIYICGQVSTKSKYYYNNGLSSTRISTNDTTNLNKIYGYFIAKLDKNGSVIWHTHLNNQPTHIAYAKNGRLAVNCAVSAFESYYNKGLDTIFTHSQGLQNFEITQSVYWINPLDGTLKSWSDIREKSTNFAGATDLTADNEGNVILTGQYEHWMKFFAPDNKDSLTVGTSTVSYGSKLFIVKYDTSGKPMWLAHSKKRVTPTSVSISKSGEIYASVHPQFGNDTILIYGSDNASLRVSNEMYNLLAINANGQIKWAAKGGMASGLGVHASDSIISVFGYNPPSTTKINDTFYAANLINNFYLPHASPNFALVYYDTSGNVLHATRAGVSNGPIMHQSEAKILPVAPGEIIIAGDAKCYNGTDSLIIYDDTLRLNGSDGFIIKSTFKVCDSINMPPAPPKVFVNNARIDTAYCAGEPLKVYGSSSGSFYAGIFVAYLSDGNGNFGNGITIGTGFTADSFSGIIPSHFPTGSNYKVRIIGPGPGTVVATSNSFKVYAKLNPSIRISSSTGTYIKEGQTVTFSSTVTDMGQPEYQWLKNGLEVPGALGPLYITDSLKDRDVVWVRAISHMPCSSADTLISRGLVTFVSTGVTDIAEHTFSIFPNPSKGKFNLSGRTTVEKITVTVVDMLGKEIYRSDVYVNGGILSNIIDIRTVKPGVYLMKIVADGVGHTMRLLVE